MPGRISVSLASMAAGLVGLLLSGCVVQSLTPYYVEAATAPMPEALGSWRPVVRNGKKAEKAGEEPWIVGQDRAIVFDDKGSRAPLKVVFFRVGDTRFVDITAAAPPAGSVNLLWLFHVVPVHTVCKVEVRGDRMVLLPMDPAALHAIEARHDLGLPHIRPMEGEDFDIYHPSPAAWQRLLVRHAGDGRLFPDSGRYELVRINPAPGR